MSWPRTVVATPLRCRSDADRGQVVPLVAAVVALVAMLALGIAGVARVAHDRARAQNAADAAALAAAVRLGPDDVEATARRLAEANGAELVELRREGTIVVVRVELGGLEAVAAARPVARVPTANP